jgi:hypothetical protein
MGETLSHFFATLGPHGQDIGILLALLVTSLIYGVTLGRDRAVVILLSLYLSLAVVSQTPLLTNLAGWLGLARYPLVNVSWFLILFLILFFLLWRSPLLQGLGSGQGSWWQAMLFGVLQIGLATTILLFLAPADMVDKLGIIWKQVFLNDWARSGWLIVPILALVFSGSRETIFIDE